MHGHYVDRGSDNGRDTAAREEIIIWKIADEEEAEVGRLIEQEFQTQTRKVAQTFYCCSRCSRAIAASNFREDGHEWMFWLQVTPRTSASGADFLVFKHSEIAGSVALPSFGEHKTSVVEMATTNCKYINKKKNEVFELNCREASDVSKKKHSTNFYNGSVLRCDVTGKILMKCFLYGMPI
uniref:Uncharacterized protein n=1 Tax=Aegilops tauschii TaxID=37682 RepID=M8C952_AEGTA